MLGGPGLHGARQGKLPAGVPTEQPGHSSERLLPPTPKARDRELPRWHLLGGTDGGLHWSPSRQSFKLDPTTGGAKPGVPHPFPRA